MFLGSMVYQLLLLVFSLSTIFSADSLTFYLDPGRIECFYKTLKAYWNYTVDYQVLSGGNQDVDVFISDLQNHILHSARRTQYESVHLSVPTDGDYKLCFSNKFSTVSDKLIFFDWFSEEEEEEMRLYKTDSLIEKSLYKIDQQLDVASSNQIRVNMLITPSITFARSLNSHVLYWSIGHSLIIILLGVIQVVTLRSFFKTPTTHFKSSVPGKTSALYSPGF